MSCRKEYHYFRTKQDSLEQWQLTSQSLCIIAATNYEQQRYGETTCGNCQQTSRFVTKPHVFPTRTMSACLPKASESVRCLKCSPVAVTMVIGTVGKGVVCLTLGLTTLCFLFFTAFRLHGFGAVLVTRVIQIEAISRSRRPFPTRKLQQTLAKFPCPSLNGRLMVFA